MKKAKVAVVYARMLLESATEAGSQSAVSADMRVLRDVFAQLPDLRRFLANPVRTSEKKGALLASATKSFAPLTLKFVKLLEMKNRLPILPDAADAFLALEESRQNILRATVQSATALDAAQLAKLAKGLEAKAPGKTYILTNEIVPSLIAGIRVKQGDTITDASIRHKLDLLRQKLAA